MEQSRPTKKVRIKKIVRETYDTSSFILEPSEENIPCKSGQFLTFLFKGYTGKEIRRSYSLSSSPELNEPLTVTIKRIPNGEISRLFLDRMAVGNEIETIGASGFFVLPENINQYHDMVFFAAGSGIAPIFSILKIILHQHPHVKALLIYSNKSKDTTIFYSSLKKLKEQFPERLSIHFLFSISSDLYQSRLRPAAIETFLQEYHIRFHSSLFYVCGPVDYMRMIVFTLMSLGVAASHIKREIFFVQPPSALPSPADTSPHTVTLISGMQQHHFNVQYPVTILQAARKLKISIPFSCETGQCGTCVAKCLHGEVWMSRNEVLLDDEIAKGAILTCTGYPVNGDVVLTI